MLVRDEPLLFHSEEYARGRVRYYRGASGTQNRFYAKERLRDMPDERPPISLPASDAEPVKPYPFQHTGRGGIISDTHIPYHDPQAIRIAIEHLRDTGHTDFVIVNGDMMDCHALSSFVKDPRSRDFAGEVEMAQDFLDELTRHFKHVVYKLGNHEKRFETYIYNKAPELIGVPEFELRRILKLDDLGVEFVRHNQVIYAGGLTILHGHEYVKSGFSPVNPARGLFLRTKASAVCGHQHQTSAHHEPDVRGKLTSTWSIGCLCDLHPEYAPLNRWNHGFATMAFDGKWFTLDTHRIIEGRIA